MKQKEKVQFSKRMSAVITAAWIVFRVLSYILCSVKPDISEVYIQLLDKVDVAMMVNMSVYCSKSVVEQGLHVWQDKGKDEQSEEDTEEESVG